MNEHKCDCNCNTSSNLFNSDNYGLAVLCSCKASGNSCGCHEYGNSHCDCEELENQQEYPTN